MIGHLGSKVSALLDGRLTPAEEERAWDHVHSCHGCRDLVEREGWVKTRLATLRPATCAVTDGFKSSLLAAASQPPVHLPGEPAGTGRRGVVVLGSSAAGVAIVGIAALGGVFGPGSTTVDRRPPTMTNIDQPIQRVTPTATSSATATATATAVPVSVTRPASARPRTP